MSIVKEKKEEDESWVSKDEREESILMFGNIYGPKVIAGKKQSHYYDVMFCDSCKKTTHKTKDCLSASKDNLGK